MQSGQDPDRPFEGKYENTPVKNSDESELGYLNSGEYFGELSLVQGLPKSVSAVCTQNTHLIYLESADLQSVISQHLQRIELEK